MAYPSAGISELNLVDAADEQRSIEGWAGFLSSYSRGEFPAKDYPPLPPLPPQHPVTAPVIPDVDDLYPSTVINKTVAQNVRHYVSVHSYFPPPRAADERLREQCIQEYDLLGDAQRSNVKQAVDLLAAFFPDTVCTFTIFNGSKQLFVAVAGDQAVRDEFGLYDDFAVRSDLGLCGHCVLVKEQLMFVPSLKDDWRFNGNPYTQAGIQSYIGAPITLPVDALATTVDASTREDGREERVGIGALNVLFVKKPLEEMSDTQTKVVRNIARMMETHLRATWDGARRTIEAKYRRAVADMIEEAFVGTVSPPSALAAPVASTLIEGTVGTITRSIASLPALARTAAEKIMALVPQLDSVVILDTRHALHAITPDNLVADPAMPVLPILARCGNAMVAPSTQSLASLINRRSSRCVFDAAHTSGLEKQLASGSRAHIVMPFSTHDRPAFTLISTSLRAQSFSSSCINHIRSLGALLLARFSQDAVIEADTAKTIFLSSISHELRTPLHSMLVALRLAFDHVQEGDWDSLRPLLEAMRSSSVVLQGTLEDVLDFGISQTGPLALSTRSRATSPGVGTPEVTAKSKSSVVDLVEIVRGAVQLCLMQRPAWHEKEVGFVYESRDWALPINEAQFRRDRWLMARIVVNGVTNALKFCCEGSIDIRLGMHATNRDVFQLSITDDGPGIEPSLIPRLLEPFAKQDVHTPGIGLGLHITKTLVQNLGGRLDITSEGMRGVQFTATLPWTDTQDRTRNDRLLDPHRHGMSDLMREVISAQCTAPRRPALAHHSRHDISGCSSSAQSNYAPLRTPEDDVQDPPRFLPVGATEGKPVDSACAVEPMRIMIIDDNDICRRLLAALVLKMVRKATKQSSQQVKPLVRQYSDGRSAVDSFLAFRPHLVLTDVSMPGMDGVTAAQHMRMLGQQQGSEFSDPFSNGYADTAQESAAGGSTQWSVGRCLIYAITGLGSSDPRLRASGMLGSAALDGWLVKGKDDMPRVEEIVRTLAAKLQYS